MLSRPPTKDSTEHRKWGRSLYAQTITSLVVSLLIAIFLSTAIATGVCLIIDEPHPLQLLTQEQH